MSRKPEQMPLDIGHEPAYAGADFKISACNAEAAAWIGRWPDWSGQPLLVVYGPPGCGKTHLSRMWQEKSQAVFLPSPEEARHLPQGPKAFVIDGVSSFLGAAPAEETLFHLYNLMKETGGHVLVTAETPPREWSIALPDLKSRLLAAPAVAIGSPDDALLAVVLTKMFSDRQVSVPQEVVAFILPRIERSFAACRRLAEEIDRKALSEKKPVTIPLVRDVLQPKI